MCEFQMSAGDWCLIESDPGVFSELIRGFGVTGVQVEEIYSLDEDSFADLKPVYGLIFLFKYTDKAGPSKGRVVQRNDVFFARQVINNACATQAILSVLMNLSDPDVSLGDNLTQLRDFTSEFDAQMKGLTISNSDVVRKVHNSFARQQIVEFEQKAAKHDDDIYHFVGYIHFKGKVFELDGLQEGPLEHCEVPVGEDWLKYARPVIEQRMGQYAQGEIHFNLMALVKDRRAACIRKIEALRAEVKQGKKTQEEINAELNNHLITIRDEEAKIRRYKEENIRRRHNYLPLIIELLEILAEQGRLVSLCDKAKEKALEKEKLKAEKRKATDISK
ncbi:ubiquitin carboxyl-terminal hydrolase isozyme L5-like isoform X1 [Varroa jacobsoni]|uniref:ubiquitin carboxyl-terminal hydrolase isozyme L5-like isoform X1 n=1 Tax=Varroa jacobsoni TaxID=62625 RepID=UPI000BF76F04|nr:ubiquitin carboxyl-terminal hydrolase isozyme L5-like isoform X1 [Varroa jacobsoni]